ncbi:MAG: methyltransferase [archaeon]
MAQPLCRYFNKCNGCSLQHIDYEVQIEHKKQKAEKALGIGRVEVFQGSPYNYRNRLDLLFGKDSLGLRAKNSPSTVIDIERCEIVNEGVNELITEIRKHFLKNTFTSLKSLILRVSSMEKSIVFLLSRKESDLKNAIDSIRDFSKSTIADNVSVAYEGEDNSDLVQDAFLIKGNELMKEKIMGKEFSYSLTGFFQTNTEIAEKMNKFCNDIILKEDTKKNALIDLYGGVGVFGIVNANLFKEVAVVDNDFASMNASNFNVEKNEAKNIKVYNIDAQYVKRVSFKEPFYAIIDPPRSGMHQKTIEYLKVSKPQKIIYVSCNLEQLRKDIAKFKNYELGRTALFDMFPQTNHIEMIVEMNLKK